MEMILLWVISLVINYFCMRKVILKSNPITRPPLFIAIIFIIVPFASVVLCLSFIDGDSLLDKIFFIKDKDVTK